MKVVKRKPSILKHLRISHEELEHLWSKGKFIDSLKHVVIVDLDDASNVDRSDDASDDVTNSNGDHTKSAGAIKSETASDTDFASYGKTMNASTPTTVGGATNHHKTTAIAANGKPKKSNAIINYLKKMNLSQMKKYLMKNPHKTTEQIKKKMKLSLKLSNPEETIHEKKKIHRLLTNNNTIECSSAFSHKKSNTKLLVVNEFVANTPPLSPKVSTTTTTTQTMMPLNVAANVSSYDGEHVGRNIDQKSSSHMKSSPISFQSTSQSCQQKTTATGADEVNVNNIIDNCFFVDDTLNCNVVLHSPFSSDNDVDGFIMSNSIEGENTMNKELLNKFHDRLEEMEQNYFDLGQNKIKCFDPDQNEIKCFDPDQNF